MATLSKIILTTVDNNSSAENGVLTKKGDELVSLGALGNTISIGLDVTHVTNMAGLVLGGAVSKTEGVEMGASRGATVGVVTELVNMEASEGIGIVTSDLPGDGGGLRSRGLLKSNQARDGGVSTNNSDYK